jgi:hypothetical protein
MSRRSVLCCAVPMLSISLAASAEEYRFSGLYTHDNLSIFLIHGAQRQRTNTFLTLQEALDQKKVVVYETGNVDQLAIENLSGEEVYIQSGDIVKGGQQDLSSLDRNVPILSSIEVSLLSIICARSRERGWGAGEGAAIEPLSLPSTQ